MKHHLVKLAYRSLLKHPSFSLISLIGLATSLAASIILFGHYLSELNFDKHIQDSERSYRIITRLGEGEFWSRTFASYGDALANCSEVETYTNFNHIKNSLVSIGENDYNIPESVIADTSFIDFFALKLLSGRKEDLARPNAVFVTEELAERFFPGEDPLGQEIYLRQYEGNRDDSIGYFTIAGLVKPLPENTHFGFEMICSMQGHFTPQWNRLKEAKQFGLHVYVRLFPGVPAAGLEARFTDLILPFLEGRPGPPVEAFNSKLQPVRDIHFTTDINRETRPVIRKSGIYILLSMGLLILILMTMNFTSAVIVQSHQHGRAMEIMRFLGATREDLFRLSLLKNAILVGMSLLLSWFIIGLSEPFLQSVLGSGWSFWSLSLKMLLMGPVIGIPVIFFATLGMRLSGKKNVKFLGVLAVIQFAIVILLLGFSLVIDRQLRYMDQKDLGFTEENIFVVRIPSAQPRGSLLVEEIKKQAGVSGASTVHHHPADVFQSMEFAGGEKSYPFAFRMVDPGSLEILEIDLLERFSAPGGALEGWVINETFYKQLLLDFSPEVVATSSFSSEEGDPDDSGTPFKIGGVMEDFHYSSLHNMMGNFAFVMRDQESLYNRWLMIRFEEGQAEAVLQATDHIMETHFPGKVFDFFLLEDKLNEQYQASGKLSDIVRLFTIIAILIALTGLYGLSHYMTRRRSKEIGIRKIQGAGTRRILLMLNLGFLKWLGLAYIVACPLTLWALNIWLVNFAYRTALPWWIIVLPGILVAVIAMMAVSWQTSAAARSNPVKTICIDS